VRINAVLSPPRRTHLVTCHMETMQFALGLGPGGEKQGSLLPYQACPTYTSLIMSKGSISGFTTSGK
jgi:hypothetical protein